MMTLMREGGFSMWLLMIFGLGLLGVAGRFALRPSRRWLAIAGALAVATLCATGTGICSDLAAVGHHAPAYLTGHPGETMTSVLLQGVAESMAPGILGLTVVGAASLLVALGLYRQTA
ncbi:MAG: hypothetical protein ABUS79_07520 [Pseudomonadota bacterium]